MRKILLIILLTLFFIAPAFAVTLIDALNETFLSTFFSDVYQKETFLKLTAPFTTPS